MTDGLPKKGPKTYYPLILAIVLIGSAHSIVMKLGFSDMPPLFFNALRLTIAAVTLAVILAIKREWSRLPGKDFLKIVGLGVLAAATTLLYTSGLALTKPEIISFIYSTVPVWTALFAGLVFKWERISAKMWSGIVLSFIGVSLIILIAPDVLSGAGWGNLIALFSSSGWALYTVLSKDLLRRYPPIQITTIIIGITVPVAWITALIFTKSRPTISTSGWLTAGFTGVFSTGLMNFLWLTAVKYLGAARTSVCTNISPVGTLILAFLVFHAPLLPLQLLGGTAVLIGVWLTIRQNQNSS